MGVAPGYLLSGGMQVIIVNDIGEPVGKLTCITSFVIL